MEHLIRGCFVFTAHRDSQSSAKRLSSGTRDLNCHDYCCYLCCNFIYKHCTTSKTINSLLYPDTACLHPKIFRFCKSRQWGLCSRKMQVNQQINKTKLDPGDKQFSLGHLQHRFSYQAQVMLVSRVGNLQCAEGGWPPSPQDPSVLHPFLGAQNSVLEWYSFSSKIRGVFLGGEVTPPVLPPIPFLWLQFQHPHVPSASAKHFPASTSACPTLAVPLPLSSPNLNYLIHWF